MKKFLIIIMTLVLFIHPVYAEQKVLDSDSFIQTIIDIVTAASVSSEQVLNDGQNDVGLNKKFINNFISYGSKYLNDESLLTDSSKQSKLMSDVFIDKINLSEKINGEKTKDYIGAKIISYKKCDDGTIKVLASIYTAPNRIDLLNMQEMLKLRWNDKRIVIGLVENDNSPFKYNICDFSLSAELAFENEVEEYFNNNYFDYINSRFGFAIQIPKSFESDLQEVDSGIVSKSIDKKAKLSIKAFSNQESWNANGYYNTIKSDTSSFIELHKDLNMVTQLSVKDDDLLIYTASLFTDQNVYQVTLEFNKSQFKDYSLSLEYIKNTFRVLNNEIG